MRNGFDVFGREKAIRVAAEFLRNIGLACFPLDLKKSLASFRKQVQLQTYEELRRQAPDPTDPQRADPKAISLDGFCYRERKQEVHFGSSAMTCSQWLISYEHRHSAARVRFTIAHEIGHILLGHHQLLDANDLSGKKKDPRYPLVEAQADAFAISALAPAPAVSRLLQAHGFSCVVRGGLPCWELTNPDAVFLRHLGTRPDPEELIMTAFGLSRTAAHRRLIELASDLTIWKRLDPGLYAALQKISHRSGWYCWVCHTRRRTASLYCPGCGANHHYEYLDLGKDSPPVIGLRGNGQFDFCAVCGNDQYPEDALFCPICGCPVVNECENALNTVGDFIRSGMWVIRGTHRCRASDLYCGTCGVLTSFGRRHGPKENMWTPNSQERRRRTGTSYPAVFDLKDGRPAACPACGSTRTIRDGRYCADCIQPLENVCISGQGAAHVCGPEDRYCPVCGHETAFFRAGFLPDYTQSETYQHLLKSEKRSVPQKPLCLFIQDDGTMTEVEQGDGSSVPGGMMEPSPHSIMETDFVRESQ